MTSAKLIRWSGPVTMLSGLLYAIGALLHPVGESLTAVNQTNWVPAHLTYWASVNLLFFGLIGLYARQVKETGVLGLIGFVLAFVGTALVASILIYVSTVLPIIASEAQGIFKKAAGTPGFLVPVFIIGFGLGWILLGVATMRAGLLPRWSGLFLIVGVILFVISEAVPFEATLAHTLVTVGDILFGFGLGWIGYSLWTEKSESTFSLKNAD